ncbi:MAG: fructosamine kinase family protein [Chloroflexi bacterium]|nr:fructosamine kinase family protein [Chloroflexota bacterium]
MRALPEPVQRWFAQRGLQIQSWHPVAGGDINEAYRLVTTQGPSFFLKRNLHAPEDMFAREAEGLQALRAAPGGPTVPEPYLWGPDFLLMEDLRPAPRRSDYWPRFGRQLAHMHQKTGPAFGFPHDNYIGLTPQPNPWTQDGYTFFAQHRLLYQAQLAHRRGLLPTEDVRAVERLAARLPEWIPEQPPSLLHGDLWSGNALTDAQGNPAIVDPAAYYGWAEADLAMTALFGAFPEIFYQAYQEVRPLEPGWRERFPLYNLYHLLNHLNLFGLGYRESVRHILRRFS